MRQISSFTICNSILILAVLSFTAKGQGPEIPVTRLPAALQAASTAGLETSGNGQGSLCGFTLFAECLIGPQSCSGDQVGSCSDECLSSVDYDGDNDVDLHDFFAYQAGCDTISCDDGHFCNGAEMCGADGACYSEFASDCNQNTMEDQCDIGDGRAADCDEDGIPDECESVTDDCDGNQRPDNCDIADGTLVDANGNGVPDQCENVIYVNAAAAPEGDGTSWLTAFSDLQDALLTAVPPAQIWVAAGTYRPAGTRGDREATFDLLDGVAVFGGFQGTESNLYGRNWKENETVLSGDLNNDDDERGDTRADNSIHVVSANSVGESAILDGFTITRGYADSEGGGGIRLLNASATFRNCTIVRNASADVWLAPPQHGAGIHCIGGSPTFIACILRDNHAADATNPWFASLDGGGHGGGAYFESSTPFLSRCIVTGNSSGTGVSGHCPLECSPVPGGPGGFGGGLYFLDSTATIENSVIAFNRAGDGGPGVTCEGDFGGCVDYGDGGNGGDGGGIHVSNSTVTLRNCSVYGNHAGAGGDGATDFYNGDPGSGGAIWGDLAATEFVSSILWDNQPADVGEPGVDGPVITYSDVQLSYPGEGNVSEDPMFVDPDGVDDIGGTSDDDFGLLDTSPCVNTGDATFVPEPGATDLAGNQRLQGCRVDMGALESAVVADADGDGAPDPCGNVIYVNAAAAPGGDGASWPTAFSDLQDALLTAAAVAPAQIWVAAGTYRPDESGGDSEATFDLLDDVALYGGFQGTESSLYDRDWRINETVLSGDLNNNDDERGDTRADNSIHVVTADGVGTGAIIDGFTLTRGFANTGGGGGMFILNASPTVRNCTIVDNATGVYLSGPPKGGGIYCYGGSPTFVGCVLRDNHAASSVWPIDSGGADGGGAYFSSSTPLFSRCRISGNSAGNGYLGDCPLECAAEPGGRGGSGGGIYFYNSSATITDSVIAFNRTGDGGDGVTCYGYDPYNPEEPCEDYSDGGNGGKGGGIYVTNSTVELRNCTIYGNEVGAGGLGAGTGTEDGRPGTGGALGGFLTNTVLTSSIVWNNEAAELGVPGVDGPVITYSDVQHSYPGEGNISENPMFADPDGADDLGGTSDDDFRLLDTSPCINTGNPTFVPGPGAEDLAGNPRLQGCRVDMGALESPLLCGE